MSAGEGFTFDDDGAADGADELSSSGGLSEHPEAVRARERRAAGKPGRRPEKVPRRKRAPTQNEITNRLRESLASLADALDERDPELARVLHRDGPKMAELLGKWGEHPKTPPPLKVAVVVIAEVLEPLRAFGATARLLLARLRNRRARALEDEQAEPWMAPEPLLDEPPPATPDRFRADADPEQFGVN